MIIVGCRAASHLQIHGRVRKRSTADVHINAKMIYKADRTAYYRA